MIALPYQRLDVVCHHDPRGVTAAWQTTGIRRPFDVPQVDRLSCVQLLNGSLKGRATVSLNRIWKWRKKICSQTNIERRAGVSGNMVIDECHLDPVVAQVGLCRERFFRVRLAMSNVCDAMALCKSHGQIERSDAFARLQRKGKAFIDYGYMHKGIICSRRHICRSAWPKHFRKQPRSRRQMNRAQHHR